MNTDCEGHLLCSCEMCIEIWSNYSKNINIKTAKDFLEQDESGVYSEQDILKAMIGFADEFSLDFAKFMLNGNISAFEKNPKQLLEIYKKQQE